MNSNGLHNKLFGSKIQAYKWPELEIDYENNETEIKHCHDSIFIEELFFLGL